MKNREELRSDLSTPLLDTEFSPAPCNGDTVVDESQ